MQVVATARRGHEHAYEATRSPTSTATPGRASCAPTDVDHDPPRRRLGPPPPRPRRADLHRRARPHRPRCRSSSTRTPAEAHAGRAQAARRGRRVGRRATVVRREEGDVNPNLATGEIELARDARSTSWPTPRRRRSRSSRRPSRSPRTRACATATWTCAARRCSATMRAAPRRSRRRSAAHLHDAGFLELETPILTRSTPEGARDFLVPSRLQPGSFYALPQSPQLFKQLFMVAGFERYYQIARCFRDEDLRADRQPEFTQLDMELSFVTEDDVIALVDGMLKDVLAVGGVDVQLPLERITYDEAMLRWGSDRPDRRIGMEIKRAERRLRGHRVQGVRRRDRPRRRDPRHRRARHAAAQAPRRADRAGQARRRRRPRVGGRRAGRPCARRSPSSSATTRWRARPRVLGATEGDTLLIVADRPKVAATVLGAAAPGGRAGRRRGQRPVLGRRLPRVRVERGRGAATTPMHHPFTAPVGRPRRRPGRRGAARPTTSCMNGTELGGGSIRINTPDVQRKVFDAIGLRAEEAEERFGFLLEALKYGAPPHGGIAFGLDRIVAMLAGQRVDPRRDGVPEDGHRRRPDDGRPGARRRAPAEGARAADGAAEAVVGRAGPRRSPLERQLEQQHVAPLAVEVAVAQVQADVAVAAAVQQRDARLVLREDLGDQLPVAALARGIAPAPSTSSPADAAAARVRGDVDRQLADAGVRLEVASTTRRAPTRPRVPSSSSATTTG